MKKSTSEFVYRMIVKLEKEGKTQDQIAKLLDCSQAWVSKILIRYRQLGDEKLLVKGKPKGKTSKLSPTQIEALKLMLVAGALAYEFPTDNWTQGRIVELVKDKFSVEYHPAHISWVMKKIGFTLQKPVHKSYRQSEAEIENWKKDTLPALKKSSK